MKTHTIQEYRPDFPPAYVANGLIGLRIGRNPLQGTALVSGYFGTHEYERVESLEAAPYPLGADVAVNGLRASERADLLAFREQSYDFTCGELTTRVDFTANGVTVRLSVLTFCSRTQPTLALQELRVDVDKACALVLRAGINPAGIPGRCIHRLVPNMGWRIADGSLLIESQGGVSQCGLAYITEFAGEAKRDYWGFRSALSTEYTVAAQPGQEYVLRQYASVVAGPATAQPDQDAIRLARVGQHSGFDLLRQENREAWAELWRGRVTLLGAGTRWQDLTDAAFFYLHTSVHASAWHSIPAFGLGHRNYFGMVMWDAEAFSFPALLLSAPQVARSVLDFRTRTLDAARRKAALHGHDGLLFGSGGRLGEEMVPSWAATVFIEQHFNLAIAKAYTQYVHANGDRSFARSQAWPVIKGIAEWIASRVSKTARGFEIRHITGPDEAIENIHNNAYTNLLAIQILREASALARRLDEEPPRIWTDIADGMALPINPQTKALLKHDEYVYKGGMYNPETLLALFPQGCELDPVVREATMQHDLALAATYIGHPMFTPFCAVLAARHGDRRFAAELLEGGVAGYVVDPFLTYAEYKPSANADRGVTPAPYMATMGAFLLSCTHGFGGLELGAGAPTTWCKYPVCLPAGWEGIEVERIWVRGQPARLTARHGDKAARIELQ